jgi:hypothetical protein
VNVPQQPMQTANPPFRQRIGWPTTEAEVTKGAVCSNDNRPAEACGGERDLGHISRLLETSQDVGDGG